MILTVEAGVLAADPIEGRGEAGGFALRDIGVGCDVFVIVGEGNLHGFDGGRVGSGGARVLEGGEERSAQFTGVALFHFPIEVREVIREESFLEGDRAIGEDLAAAVLLEGFEVIGVEVVEGAGEAVAQGVHGRTGFAGLGAGSGREERVLGIDVGAVFDGDTRGAAFGEVGFGMAGFGMAGFGIVEFGL